MIASEFADMLKALGDAYLEGDLRKSPPSLAVVVKDLQAFERTPISDVISELKAGRLPKKKKPPRPPKPKPQPNPAVVGSYVSKLLEASTHEEKFDEVFSELSVDKSVRPALELAEILSVYSDGALMAGTKPQRLKLLKTAFHQRVRAKQTEEIAENSSPF